MGGKFWPPLILRCRFERLHSIKLGEEVGRRRGFSVASIDIGSGIIAAGFCNQAQAKERLQMKEALMLARTPREWLGLALLNDLAKPSSSREVSCKGVI